MEEKVITDNTSEKITVKWDGERFVLVKENRIHFNFIDNPKTAIVLNHTEMLELVRFYVSVRWEEKHVNNKKS